MSRILPYVARHAHACTVAAAAAALATAASLASPRAAVAAEPGADTAQTAVYYSLGDLSTDQGIRALYRRIVNAAETVCPVYDSQDLSAFVYSRECQRQAVARAVRQIANPRLAAVYERELRRHG